MIAFLSAARAQDSTLPVPYTTVSLFELTATWMRNLHFSEGSYGPEAPLKITLCQLKSNPGAYNHKLIDVAGFISHGFENFTIFDPDCSSWPAIWLEYGGTAASGTLYCCGIPAVRSRPKPLVIEKIRTRLVNDALFRQFDNQLQRRPDSIMRATIVGRFFAGEKTKLPDGQIDWSGYGDMGCCSLLAIEQVVSVDPQDRDDLDYGASANQPDINKVGCGYGFLTDVSPFKDSRAAQWLAEQGEREWAFSNPERVATDAFARILKIYEKTITGMRQTRQAQGRFVYEWKPEAKGASYMIVISRPYLLSLYAKDPKRVAWIVRAAYGSSCKEDNSVRRVR